MFLACTFFCPKRPPDERALGPPLGANRRHRAAQRGHPPRQRPAYARTKDKPDPTAWMPLHLVGASVPLDTETPRSAARAPQSMLRSASSLTPVDPPALAMISRMSNARSTDCTAPAVAFCASIMGSAPITQSKGTAPQCDSASIRHRDETSGYGGLPLARCGVFRVRPAGCMTRVTEHTGTSAMAR